MDSITDKLKQDHDELNSLIYLITEDRTNQDDFTEILKKIRWRLNKHMYIEEKTIFSYCEIIAQINLQKIHALLNEHDVILAQLATIEKLTNSNQIKEGINSLGHKINEHIEFEIRDFYNLMDKTLIPEDKQKILQMISKDFNIGFYPLQKIREYGMEILKHCTDSK